MNQQYQQIGNAAVGLHAGYCEFHSTGALACNIKQKFTNQAPAAQRTLDWNSAATGRVAILQRRVEMRLRMSRSKNPSDSVASMVASESIGFLVIGRRYPIAA